MNSPETQSDSSSQETYFDPEVVDTSEQEFSASLEISAQPTGFVVDSAEIQPQPDFRAALGPARPPTGGADSVQGPEDRPLIAATEEASISALKSEDGTDQAPTDWRHQVSAKVKNYKTQNPRKERYPSLQLQFDSVLPWKGEKSPLLAEREDFLASAHSEAPAPAFEPEPRSSYPVSSEATARVLEFPRPGMLPFNRDELAEPVNDRPRILEAPELLPPPPALGGMLIEPVREPEPERQPGVDMPLKTAPLSRRMLAASVDGIFVAGAIVIFGYIFLRFNPSLPQIRMTAEVTAVLTVLLWFAYQSAFLIFCGTTPGLRATRLKISCFDGAPASRNLRRWRVIASALSLASLGLGYAWTVLDEDQLSWHDRITKTHLAPKN